MSARGARGRASYGRSRAEVFGGAVAGVDEGGAAARAGLAPGDLIVEAGGFPLDDELDWRWHADGASVRVMLSDGRTLTLEREAGEPWGLTFADPLFDGIHTCTNDCEFCFMAQLPEGMRPSLYLRDDDFRLSFLQGNFITLTNLRDRDVRRICEQALSPLYVSLHSVEPEVRERLVGCRNDRALERFDELVEGGVELHVQIVLVPGVNDGEHLERSLTWLAEREGVVSVGVVPVGRTQFQTAIERSYEDAVDAAAVIARVAPWQAAMAERDGVAWVYLADEFYLNAGAAMPPAEHYAGFPQYENGIGMVRAFEDGWAAGAGTAAAAESPEGSGEAASHTTSYVTSPATSYVTPAGEDRSGAGESAASAPAAPAAPPKPRTLVTGSLFAPVLRRFVPDAQVLSVRNRFFGGNVSVAGLLTGTDIIQAINAHGGHRYAIPDSVLNVDGVTLDDMTPEDIARETEVSVAVVESSPAGLAEALGLAAPQAPPDTTP